MRKHLANPAIRSEVHEATPQARKEPPLIQPAEDTQMSKQDLKIRRGTLADAHLLSELGARTFTETFAADNTEEDLADYLAKSNKLRSDES